MIINIYRAATVILMVQLLFLIMWASIHYASYGLLGVMASGGLVWTLLTVPFIYML